MFPAWLRPRGVNCAANAVAIVVVVLIGVWLFWAEVSRRAEQQAAIEHAAAAEQRAEQERAARVARIPKLPAYQELKREAAAAHAPRPRRSLERKDEAFMEQRPALGPRACCVAADQNDHGFAWLIAAEGGKPANATLQHAGQSGPSNTLRFTMGPANFALPHGCAGVLVQIKWNVACDFYPPAETTDLKVALTSGGVQVGKDNKALNARLPATPAFVAYGGAADTWGYAGAIPKAIVNASDFGVDICVNMNNGYDRATISEVDITVYERNDGANVGSAKANFLELPSAVSGRRLLAVLPRRLDNRSQGESRCSWSTRRL